ncbi:MAG: hypothetical protein ACREMY_12420 [bacterium]
MKPFSSIEEVERWAEWHPSGVCCILLETSRVRRMLCTIEYSGRRGVTVFLEDIKAR